MRPVVIAVAITGSVPRKKDNPALPVTVAEQVESTQQACEAGATLVHLHVRNPDESSSTDIVQDVANVFKQGNSRPSASRARYRAPDAIGAKTWHDFRCDAKFVAGIDPAAKKTAQGHPRFPAPCHEADRGGYLEIRIFRDSLEYSLTWEG